MATVAIEPWHEPSWHVLGGLYQLLSELRQNLYPDIIPLTAVIFIDPPHVIVLLCRRVCTLAPTAAEAGSLQ